MTLVIKVLNDSMEHTAIITRISHLKNSPGLKTFEAEDVLGPKDEKTYYIHDHMSLLVQEEVQK